MKTRFNKAWLLVSLCLAQLAFGQGRPEELAKIVDEGKNRNQIMLHMRHLTKKIGPRLLGSKNLQTACDWTMKKFRDFGLQNVHFEPVTEVPVRFDRGKRQVAKMIKPVELEFQFTTAAWSAGTPGAVRGKAILEPTSQEEFDEVKDKLKGAWVISASPGLAMRDTAQAANEALRQAVSNSGIAGRVFGSTDELLHTNGNFRNVKWDDLPKEPQVIVRASDMKAVRDRLAGAEEVVLEFDIENKFSKGPVTVGNVIADIPGTEKPDEYVIVSAHLDSWDGPGSEGAQDNGTGAMSVLEAARILVKCGVKPKRTIRFALWIGEEEGLLGSQSYVEKHKSEWGKTAVCLVDDNGTNYASGITCPEPLLPFFKESIDLMNKAFPECPETLNSFRPQPTASGVRPRRGGGGSDHAPFNAVGIPGLFLRKAGRANYFLIWHTQNDRLEQVIPEYMRQVSTSMAVLGYNLACADGILPRA